jgi:fused signal recognition particle receptor
MMSAQVWIAVAVVAVILAVIAIVVVRRPRRGAEKFNDSPIAGSIRTPITADEAAPPGFLVSELANELIVPEFSASTAEDRLSAAPATGDLDFGFEIPDSAVGRMHRLRARLSRSNNAIGKGLLGLLSRDNLDEETWEEIEETLLTADLGVGPTMELLEQLRSAVRVEGNTDQDRLTQLLREGLLALVDPTLDRSLVTKIDGRPAVVLVVGVNGTGKTTTTGKLARLLIAEGQTVLLGAADTFRAAAAEQLQTWGDRVGAPVVRSAQGADPAAVAFDAVATAIAAELDTAVIDTAGRLHTKTGLMDELGKVQRVIEKQSPVDEVLLVLDATTGQNGLVQARVFAEVVNVTGVVLTKLDGTARGGIVIAVQRELGVPVKLVGLGEGPDDLALFDPIEFVEAIING